MQVGDLVTWKKFIGVITGVEVTEFGECAYTIWR